MTWFSLLPGVALRSEVMHNLLHLITCRLAANDPCFALPACCAHRLRSTGCPLSAQPVPCAMPWRPQVHTWIKPRPCAAQVSATEGWAPSCLCACPPQSRLRQATLPAGWRSHMLKDHRVMQTQGQTVSQRQRVLPHLSLLAQMAQQQQGQLQRGLALQLRVRWCGCTGSVRCGAQRCTQTSQVPW